MNAHALADGLINYLFLLALLTFHEFAHAWTAWKCGDDTARNMGRVSLNPIVHIDPLGTVVLPLFFIVLGSATSGMPLLFGWAKPVPVNVYNLKRGRVDDTLVAMAGPAMNLLLAAILMAAAKAGMLAGSVMVVKIAITMAYLSLVLCFFNLLPVPPLDGSHLIKNLIGMSYDTYWKLCRYGFLIVVALINIPGVRRLLLWSIQSSLNGLANLCRIDHEALFRLMNGI